MPEGRRFGRRSGQSLVEFGMIAPFLFMLMIGAAVIIVSFLQSWALGRATTYLGESFATGGAYNGTVQSAFVSRAQTFGVDLVPARDTLAIKVTSATGNGPCGSPSCTYTWGDSPSVRYGDFIELTISKGLSIPGIDTGWLNGIFGAVPGARAAWSGVAQRDSAGAGVVVPPSSSAGVISGTVRDSQTSAVLVGATVTLSSGPVTTTDSFGSFQFSGLAAGSYTVSGALANYQSGAATVTLASGNATLNQDIYLTPGAQLTVTVVPAGGTSDYVTNGNFETYNGYPTAVAADSPIGYWRLNELSGSSAADASGSAFTGAYTGPATSYVADPFHNVTSNGWGSAPTGGLYTVTGTAANYSAGTYGSGDYGAMVQTATNTVMLAYPASVSAADTNQLISVQTDKAATGASLTAGLVSRLVDTSNYYSTTVVFGTSGAITIQLDKQVAGVTTNLVAATAATGTHAANAIFYVRLQTFGTSPATIRARVWSALLPEPSAWTVTTTDATAALQAAGANKVGVRSLVTTGNTASPNTFRFDEYHVEGLSATTCTCSLGQPGALASGTNSAVDFDGTGSSVSVPDAPNLNFGTLSGATGLTLEAWYKRTSGSAATLIAKGGATYALAVDDVATDGGKVVLLASGLSTLATSTVNVTADGLYHYIVATASLATSGSHATVSAPKLYVDGVDVTGATGSDSFYDTSSPVSIGRDPFLLQQAANGKIDEVAIYRSALSAARVLVHYQAGALAGSINSWSNGAAPFALAPVSLTAVNSPIHGGRSAAKVVTNTTANQGFLQGLGGTFAAGIPYSLSVWVNGTSGEQLAVYLGDSASANYASAAATAAGGWQQLTLTWTPTATVSSGVQVAIRANSGEAVARTLYVDDVRVWNDGTGAVTGVTVTTSYGLAATEIGNGQYSLSLAAGTHTIRANTSGGLFGSGSVTLAAGEVKTLTITLNNTYASTVLATAGLTSLYRLDETSGTVMADATAAHAGAYGAGYTLNQAGATTAAGTAVLFGSGHSYASVTYGSGMGLADGPFSIEFWVKRTTLGAGNFTVADWGNSGGVRGPAIAFKANKLSLSASGGSTITSESATTADTSWHQFVITKNGASVHIYKDGADMTGAVTNLTLGNPSQTLSLGDSAATSESLDGTLDEFAFYGVVLSPSTVAAHYAAR